MEYIIDSNYENVRIDKFIRKKYKDIPLSHIYRMLRTGKIKVNGKKVKESYNLILNDIVKIYTDDRESCNEFITLTQKDIDVLLKGIVFENDEIFLFNKPAGIPVHKGTGFDYGIVEIAKSYFKNSDINPVNRIDKATSGLVIFGKNNKGVREYIELLQKGEVRKFYFVGVEGIPMKDEFTIVSKLEKGETRVDESEEGKEAVTHYKVLQKNEKYSLLEAEIVTGRTHQIRVQMEKNNTPIIGDGRYGTNDGKKMLLFSYRVIINSKGIDFSLEMPEIFKKYF